MLMGGGITPLCECALILMNVILRGSILYACEMYYDLKENELRQIERIEEGYLRQIFKTTKGCPITQLYLEVGQTPARFEIQKMRLLFMKYILEQDKASLLSKFFQLQLEQQTRGDWASTCLKDLKELRITESLEQIKLMTKNKFTSILKERVKENAFKYLLDKRGKKGKEIHYSGLEMSEYLLPTNQKLTIDEKRKMFAVKNRMIDIPANFPKTNKDKKCFCGKIEDMVHIYNCEVLNSKPTNLQYQAIFTGNITQQIEVFKRFEQNLGKRETINNENKPPCDPCCDPLFSVDDSNG